MKRLIITPYRDGILSAVHDGKRICFLDWDKRDGGIRRGDIYRGVINGINRNIDAAFADLGGTNGYLPHEKGGKVRVGEEMTLQVEREAVKTKLPVLTAQLSLPGRYLVLLPGRSGIRFSRRLSDESRLSELREALAPYAEQNGFIVRTNAAGADMAALMAEAERLVLTAGKVLTRAEHSPAPARILQAESPWTAVFRDLPEGETEEILTDDEAVYEELRERLREEGREGRLRRYDDAQLPLSALYSLETEVARALGKRVWLKSGGYLVIEPTEAMTVIDVNTGKNDGHKSFEETIFRTNLEAAEEIAVQLRLRGISGIVIVDFINMKEEEHRRELLEALTRYTAADPVHTAVEGMTRLGLVEITREKRTAPLAEKLAASEDFRGFSKNTEDFPQKNG